MRDEPAALQNLRGELQLLRGQLLWLRDDSNSPAKVLFDPTDKLSYCHMTD